jgi:hypothetical protein
MLRVQGGEEDEEEEEEAAAAANDDVEDGSASSSEEEEEEGAEGMTRGAARARGMRGSVSLSSSSDDGAHNAAASHAHCASAPARSPALGLPRRR